MKMDTLIKESRHSDILYYSKPSQNNILQPESSSKQFV